MIITHLHLLPRHLTLYAFMARRGRTLPVLLKVLSYVMTNSQQMVGKLSVTCMDFEGISLEMPLMLYVVDVCASYQGYCW
jgi:hypothetical protein